MVVVFFFCNPSPEDIFPIAFLIEWKAWGGGRGEEKVSRRGRGSGKIGGEVGRKRERKTGKERKIHLA